MSRVRRIPASIAALIALTGCPQPATVAPPTVGPSAGPGIATPRPQPTSSFGAPVFPVPRPVGTRPPDPTPEPSASPDATPAPIPTTVGTPPPDLPPSAEPTLPPPPGVEAYDLPQLSVNANLMHGGKGPGSLNGNTTQMQLRAPIGLAYGTSDTVFIADAGNHQIRSSKTLDTPSGPTRVGEAYAGSGIQGHADGVDTKAEFNTPRGVAVGPQDTLYVADSLNHCIRRVRIDPNASDQTPRVETIAGSRTPGHKDAVGADAQFNEPWGVALDKDGNTYVTDTLNQCVRKITPARVVTTLAGVPGVSGHKDGAGKTAQFTDPKGIAVDANGDIYVCDTGNHCIRKITSAGTVTTVAGVPTEKGLANGPGLQAKFDTPIGIVIKADGVAYISDFGNNRVRLMTKKGVVSVFTGTDATPPVPVPRLLDGPGALALLDGPQGIIVDGKGDLYVAEETNHAVRKILIENVVTTHYGSTTPGDADDPLSLAGFKQPHGIVYDGKDRFYIADTGNHTIRIANRNGAVTTLAGKAGEAGKTDGKGANALFDSPRAVTLDAQGNCWVADEGNQLIRKIAPDGTVTTVAGSGNVGFADGQGTAAVFNTPRGIAAGPDGNVYVADFGNHRIRKITPTGAVTTLAGDGVSGFSDARVDKARFAKPSGLFVDNQNRIYIADFGNNAIRVIQKAPEGTDLLVGTLAGAVATPGYKEGSGATAQFNDPWSLTVDTVGRVFVADFGNSLIRKITPDGTVSRYAGALDSSLGTPLSGHKDGAGSDALFAAPAGVAIDEFGYVYVVDTENNCIRKIH